MRITGSQRGLWRFRGVDDWLCFVQDPQGRWFFFHTECSGHALDLPSSIDPMSAEGVLATALLMAGAGERPRAVDPADVDQLDVLFGEPAVARGSLVLQ